MLDAGKFDDPQQGSSINTDVMTDVSSPEAAVDVDDSHCKSDQSTKVSDSEVVDSQSKSDQYLKVSDSEDQQDLNDGISIIDIMMREEFDKTTFSTNPVADEGSGGATFTKRFQDDDEGYAFTRQCEEKLYDGQIAIRPLRNTPIGTVQTLSKNDLSFLKFAEREQIRLYFLQTCPKRRWTMVKKKKVESKSYLRYQAFKDAETVQRGEASRD